MLEQLTSSIQNIATPVFKTVQTIFLSLAILAGANPQPIIINQPVDLGASISAASDFRTSLANGITSSATTMSLASFTTGSESLVLGNVYGFKLGGSEYVIGTASTSNQIINMTRGLSHLNGTTSIAAYQQPWGRATAVEMTDAPILLDQTNKLNGLSGFETPIKYADSVSTTTVALNGQNFASVAYANGLSFGAIPPASETAAGFVELATPQETASGTLSGGTSYRLAIPANVATSTWVSTTTSSNRLPVTNSQGIIPAGFVGSSTNLYNTGTLTTTGTSTLTASSTFIGSLNVLDVGKNIQIFTASSTFTVPAGVRYLDVELVGGGSSGIGSPTGDSSIASQGGGGGAYVRKIIDVSGTTSIAVVIGAGGVNTGTSATWGNGSATSFGNFLTAAAASEGTGGVATGGTINIDGETGSTGLYLSNAASNAFSGMGGRAYPYGRGSRAAIGSGSSPSVAGVNGTGYGSGGSGVIHTNGDGGKAAGNGVSGVAIIHW